MAAKARESVIRPARDTAIIADSVQRAQVIGLKVAGDDLAPLAVGISVQNSDVRIERVEVTGARVAGVEYRGASQGILHSSYIHHNAGTGIVIHHPASPSIESNLIVENGKGGQLLPGLEILSLAQPAVFGNTFADNGAEGVWQTGSADPALLERNFFGINPNSPASGKVRVVPSIAVPR